jgi:hypothetical protein
MKSRIACAFAVFCGTNPLPDCIGDRIRGEDPAAAPADAAAPTAKPVPAPTQTVAMGPTATPKAAPTAKRGVSPAAPAPQAPPPPGATTAPPPATTTNAPPPPPPGPASPGRHLEFSAGHGQHGYLYPRQQEFIAVSQQNAGQFHKCFAGVVDAWSVRIVVTVPQKGGPITFPMRIIHEGSPDASPQGKAILDCHAASIKTWPWPQSGGIDPTDAGAGYLVILSAMVWKAD